MRLLLLLPLNLFLLRLDELVLAQLPVDLDVATIVGLTLESADPDRRADVSLIRRSVQDDGQRRVMPLLLILIKLVNQMKTVLQEQ